MKQIIHIISKAILIIAFLNIFAYSIYHVYHSGERFGSLTSSIKAFVEFPKLVIGVFEELTGKTTNLKKVRANFSAINQLPYEVFAIDSHFEAPSWIISLKSLNIDSTIHQWRLHESNYLNEEDRIFSRARPLSPILLEDKSIITHLSPTSNLYRIDSASNVLWHNTELIFHHTSNLDAEGNIWACTRKSINLSKVKQINYLDDCITKVDANNGEILYHKSIREILIENGLSYMMSGTSNYSQCFPNSNIDPFHLNDIEPVLKDGAFWKKGDVFLSIRNRSAILLFRPSTNKLLKVIQGPFFHQHDIDIRSDSTISLFNNNKPAFLLIEGENTYLEGMLNAEQLPLLNKVSEVLTYNFKTDKFNSVYQAQFKKHEIFSAYQGLHHFLDNQDLFIENQNKGEIYIFNDRKTLLKKHGNPIVNQRVEVTNWLRIYETLDFLKN